jgi:signal transduction histidine kinase/ligand-binding sensor domain-containing protein
VSVWFDKLFGLLVVGVSDLSSFQCFTYVYLSYRWFYRCISYAKFAVYCEIWSGRETGGPIICSTLLTFLNTSPTSRLPATRSCTLSSSLCCGANRNYGIGLLFMFLLLAVSSTPAPALDPAKHIGQYGHDMWTSQQGLPGQAVEQILQSADGYLWLRTAAGLVRFDGVRFTLMDAVAGNEPVKAIAMSADGDLLVRSTTKTMVYRNGTFSEYALAAPLPDGAVESLFEDMHHHLFLGSDDFLYMVEHGGIRLLRGRTTWINAFLQTDAETTWIGGQQGLYFYKDGKLSAPIQVGNGETVNALSKDYLHRVWIGTYHGLYRRDSDSSALQHVFADSIHNAVNTILEDRTRNLWVGTDTGLSRLVGTDHHSFGFKDGLTDNKVLSLFEDREGSLWVGTAMGLDRFRNTKVTAFTVSDGLPSDNVRSVIAGRNGEIYVVSDPGGLARIRHDVVSAITEPAVTDWRGHALFESSDGSLWMGLPKGLTRFKDGRFTVYGGDGRFSKRFISAIGEDNEGLIVSTSETLALRFKDGKVSPLTIRGKSTPLSVAGNYTFTIYRDDDGALWFGTVKGLYKFSANTLPEDAQQKSVDFPVTSISNDHRGNLWLGGRTSGLIRFRIADGHITRYTKRDGLFDDSPSKILYDAVGNLWISNSDGIYMADRKDLDDFADGRISVVRTVSYGISDGMKTSEAAPSDAQPTGGATPDGRLWYATRRGIVVVDPQHLVQNTFIPPVIIENFVVNEFFFPVKDGLQIAPGKDKVEFDYTGLSLRRSKMMKFKYQLEGYDHGWVDAGQRRIAFYTNLSPGQYRFRVIACNDDGVWNNEGASIRFYLLPRFYQTRWFYALSGLATLVILVGGIQINTRRLRAGASELTRIVNERTNALQMEVAERRRAEQTAKTANESKSMFLANMSHELRTPLNAILGYAQLLLRDRNLNEWQTRASKTIHQSGEHLLMLITDILDLSKIEARKLDLQISEVELSGFLSGIANIIRIKTEERELEFGCEIASDLPKLVLADPKRLRQVLLNLLSNAVKFTDKGRVDMEVKVVSRSSSMALLRFEVRDTGVGIAPEYKETIFKPFEQVGDNNRRSGGTGLGLSISRQLVSLMGSEIKLESSLGHGSVFSFELSTPLVELSGAKPPTTSGQIVAYSGPRKSVLIVDDVNENISVLVDILTGVGFEISEARDGVEAVEQACLLRPDLISMDVRMPLLDGLGAICKIRQIADLQTVPIVANSEGANLNDRARSFAAGASAFVPRPIERGHLLEEIGKLLDLSWIYGDSDLAGPIETVPTETFTLPAFSEMVTLCDMARAGNMRAIKQYVDDLTEVDAQYRPFARQIKILAKEYQSKALLKLVEKYAAQSKTAR